MDNAQYMRPNVRKQFHFRNCGQTHLNGSDWAI